MSLPEDDVSRGPNWLLHTEEAGARMKETEASRQGVSVCLLLGFPAHVTWCVRVPLCARMCEGEGEELLEAEGGMIKQ